MEAMPHKYDVDAVRSYYEMIECFNNNEVTNKNINKDSFISDVKNMIRDLWIPAQIDFDHYFNSRSTIVIPSTSNLFTVFLANYLMFCDINKLELILDHQKENFERNDYAEKDNFVGFMEFTVYDRIKQSYPFDNREILSRIVAWVKKNRSGKTLTANKKKKAEVRKTEMSMACKREIENCARKEFSVLKGKYKGRNILANGDSDLKEIVENLLHLINKEKNKEIENRMRDTGLPKGFIVELYRRVYDKYKEICREYTDLKFPVNTRRRFSLLINGQFKQFDSDVNFAYKKFTDGYDIKRISKEIKFD